MNRRKRLILNLLIALGLLAMVAAPLAIGQSTLPVGTTITATVDGEVRTTFNGQVLTGELRAPVQLKVMTVGTPATQPAPLVVTVPPVVTAPVVTVPAPKPAQPDPVGASIDGVRPGILSTGPRGTLAKAPAGFRPASG